MNMKILYLLLLTFTFVACKDKIIEKVEIDFCEKIKTEGIQIERTEFGFAGFKRVYNQSGLLIAIKSLSYKVDTDSLKYDNQNKLVVRIKYNAFDGKGIGKAGEIDSLSYDIKNKLLGIKTYYFAEKQILMRKSTSFFYNVGGHIEKQITETGPRQIKYRFEWQNNNMIKSDVLNFADEVIYSTIFEYDNKKTLFPHSFKTQVYFHYTFHKNTYYLTTI